MKSPHHEATSAAGNYVLAGTEAPNGRLTRATGAPPHPLDSRALILVFTMDIDVFQVGTGFVFGGGRAATAFHNIAQTSASGQHRNVSIPFVVSSYWGDVYEARIAAIDPSRDVAILEVHWRSHPALALSSQPSYPEAEQVVVPAFFEMREGRNPERYEAEPSSDFRIETLTIAKPPIGTFPAVKGDASEIWLSNSRELSKGWSGCPVLLPDGTQVAGMITRLVMVKETSPASKSPPSVYPVGVWARDIADIAAQETKPLPASPAASETLPNNDARPASFPLLIKGLRALSNTDFKTAESALSAFIALQPDSLGGHLLLSYILRKSSKMDLAEELLRKAVTMAPSSVSAKVFLGDFLLSTGRGSEGIEELRTAAAMDPHCMLAIRLLLAALVANKRYAEVVDLGTSLNDSLSQNAYVLADLGIASREQGRYDEAVRLLTEASRLFPEWNNCRAMLADTLAVSGRIKEAEMCYIDLTKVEQNNPVVWYRYARFLVSYMPENKRAALRAIETAESLNTANSRKGAASLPSERIEELRRKL
jgi:tetratricopeptide (TPR) repeat protein